MTTLRKLVQKNKYVTLLASNGKERRIRGYRIKSGIAYVPHGILSKLGKEVGFNGPEYWAKAVDHNGQSYPVCGYRVQSERGHLSQFTKDHTAVEQLYETE